MANTMIRISDAAVLALHAVDFLARAGGKPCPTRHIASRLGVSYNHLVKVMQRLTRAGLLLPGRGPKGGFILSKKAETGKLLDVYEAIDGRFSPSDCLMKRKTCGRPACLLGGLLPGTILNFRKAMGRSVLRR